jgi:hypothetical protein
VKVVFIPSNPFKIFEAISCESPPSIHGGMILSWIFRTSLAGQVHICPSNPLSESYVVVAVVVA